MKMIRTICLGVALATASTAALAGAPPVPAASGQVDAGFVKKFLAFFDKIVDTALADKSNCNKMAVDLNHLIDANKALLDQAAKERAKGHRPPQYAIDHMMAGTRKMMPALMACKDNHKVMAAFQRLHVGPPRHR